MAKLPFRERMHNRIAERRARGDSLEKFIDYVQALCGQNPAHARSWINCLSEDEKIALANRRVKRARRRENKAKMKAAELQSIARWHASRPPTVRMVTIKLRNGRTIEGRDLKGSSNRYDYRFDGEIIRIGKRTRWVYRHEIAASLHRSVPVAYSDARAGGVNEANFGAHVTPDRSATRV
jgi:hypothetical protein